MKAHASLKYWRPDEVVECIDGIPDDLYKFVWEEIVPLYDSKRMSPEEREIPDDTGEFNTTMYWDKFSDEHKKALNEAMAKEEAKWK